MFSELSKVAKWARHSHTKSAGVVVAFPNHLPYGVALETIAAGLVLQKSKDCAPHYFAVLFQGPEEAKAALVKAVKPPKSRGSRTAGNCLPW